MKENEASAAPTGAEDQRARYLVFRSMQKFKGGHTREMPIALAVGLVKSLRGSLYEGDYRGDPVTIIDTRDGRTFVACDPPFDALVAQLEGRAPSSPTTDNDQQQKPRLDADR